jgi:mannose-6-phosphate isomerase-like protein (cupin superfamily)
MLSLDFSALGVASSDDTPVLLGGLSTIIKVPGAALSGLVAVIEHTLAPGFLGAPPHLHEHEDEISYVLEGTLTVLLGESTIAAPAGALVVKPRGIVHTCWNVNTAPVRFLEIISPGGFERYFAERARLVPEHGPPDAQALAALRRKYGLHFDMDRLPELMRRHNLRLT